MLKLISFLYHDMIAKRKKKKKENASEAHLKRQTPMFEKRSKRKWHERKNSLQNKLTQAKFRGMVIAEKKKKNGGIEWH